MRVIVAASITLLSQSYCAARAQTQTPEAVHALDVRFIDAATGYAVQPDVSLLSGSNAARSNIRQTRPDASGRLVLESEPGASMLTISSPDHEPMSVAVPPGGRRVQFVLDPLEPPAEIHPDRIRSLHRPDAMVVLGYVVDDDSGKPLSNVRVESAPSGVSTRTDARGFFQLHVPLSPGQSEGVADLSFHRPGYAAEEFHNVELWSNGDWTYRVRMQRGRERRVTDEREWRRRAPPVQENTSEQRDVAPAEPAPEPAPLLSQESVQLAASPGVATVRAPRNIRVLLTNGVVEYVSMELYVRRSLPREWIASWNNQPGGINSLKAGAVAVRSYAAFHVRNPRNNSDYYDICATTSCQVYGSSTFTATDTAVSQTANYMIVTSAGFIARSEYSSENNSIGFPCGDSYTSPTGGCLFDPVCSGEPRSGHGRGMCQWGTIRWASGRKFSGRSMSDTSSNGHPQQDWLWIVGHYYPQLTLVQANPLVIGDSVRVMGIGSLSVRACANGAIQNGVNCPQITTKPSGATGVIIGGPVLVTSDERGHTWWRIRWNDANSTIGWSAENWLERAIPVPSNLVATPVSSSRIDLAWTNPSELEHSIVIERALAATGPWTPIATFPTAVTSYSDTTVSASTTYHYRVRGFALGVESDWSLAVSARTPGLPPVLAPIPDKTVTQGLTLTFTNAATAEPVATVFADFENFNSGTGSGTVLFRQPSFSGTTSGLLNSSPNLTSVTGSFPSGNNSSRALHAAWSWNSSSSPWLRLTATGTANLPNPVVDFTKQLRFDMHTDRALFVGIGLRETVVASGTPIGANGGSSGAIEWAGVTNRVSGQPRPTRLVSAGAWTTLTFDLPNEPIFSFTGNHILHTESGLGALEHLAFVPADGVGTYNVHLDNFAVLAPKTLTYSLAPGAPSGASVNPFTGVFTWTPDATQSPGNYSVTVRVTDDDSPPQSAERTFTVTVAGPPRLEAIELANGEISFTWNAVPGTRYRVQFKNDLAEPGWIDLEPDLVAEGPAISFTIAADTPERFFRVRVVTP